MYKAFNQGDIGEVVNILNATLAGACQSGAPTPDCTNDQWAGRDERFFHAIFTITFRLLGIPVKSEVHSARGRCNALVELPERIYLLEFKLDRPAAEALEQIQQRGYLEPYADNPRRKFAVGVRVGTEEKQILDWVSEEV